ncbi:PTS fructose transporter subunit IIB [Enterococcus sp. JM4C]|uniref:mannose/fructose/sorbose PTS transporter subunit IIB n=1 Tax=Candidatus Enterococcus huntleyi TaxID=1857217 RepID=UPI001379AB24|nr:mannose/fructose/sorbose PTS transporter subunit IIB [Enterococcus sp. JM4C]KAF1297128.1 PTS fructose transporter subunit IIB [Enterococcus sp. JM4C]
MGMDIRLARIDDRLIHGQVATAWSKSTDISRILVVSDEVAHDELRKFLLKEAAPPGIKSNVITIKKMIEVYNHDLFNGIKVMLLFTNPVDVAQLVRAGIKFSSINIGGMRFTDGKRMITNFVSIDETDIEAFRYLDQQGVELEIRKVPADRKVNLMELLQKEKK